MGGVFITVWLYASVITASDGHRKLTRQPTKWASTTKLDAYVKVAPVSGSMYFLWPFSFTNSVSSLQSLPCNKRSAGSASQKSRITAYSTLVITFALDMQSRYLALAHIIYRLEMHSVIFLDHMYVLNGIISKLELQKVHI